MHGHNYRNGSTFTTRPSTAKDARPLDPDAHPWERQPDEPDEAYRMFVVFRDLTKRRLEAVVDAGKNEPKPWRAPYVRDMSSRWSWGHRAFCWDRYMGAVDTEELVRYRREMNDRQRTSARLAQQKLANWLLALDPSTLKPLEAARWFEIAVKVERDAAGVDAHPTLPGEGEDEESEGMKENTLADIMGIDPTVEAEFALALHRMTKPKR
jgi:hypothetical protein